MVFRVPFPLYNLPTMINIDELKQAGLNAFSMGKVRVRGKFTTHLNHFSWIPVKCFSFSADYRKNLLQTLNFKGQQ